ncbi:hypothetical protein PSPO01_09054 [Paraphaeosphaeria sporulosa]
MLRTVLICWNTEHHKASRDRDADRNAVDGSKFERRRMRATRSLTAHTGASIPQQRNGLIVCRRWLAFWVFSLEHLRVGLLPPSEDPWASRTMVSGSLEFPPARQQKPVAKSEGLAAVLLA